LPHRTSRVASTHFQEEEAGEAIADEKGGAEREGRRCSRVPAEEREMGEVTESERGDARCMMMAWLICSGTTTLM